MVEIDLDISALDALRRGFSPASQRAYVGAVKAESFRLKKVSDTAISSGQLGLPGAAPLTEAERRSPGLPPLAALAGGGGRRSFIGYQVEEHRGDVTAQIGFGRGVSRARSPGGRKRQLVALFGGSEHPITREDQARIARKQRRRLGEPVSRSRAKTARGRANRRSRRGDQAWAHLLIPKVGTVVRWPARDWVTVVVAREHRNTVANVAALYRRNLRGDPRLKRWWDESGRVR